MYMETSPNASRRLLRRGILAAAVLVLIVVLFWWGARPKPIAVIVATAETGKVETTVANTRAGSVTACRRANRDAAPAYRHLDIHPRSRPHRHLPRAAGHRRAEVVAVGGQPGAGGVLARVVVDLLRVAAAAPRGVGPLEPCR